MKLCEVILKNFRGYYPETRIKIDNLTALIGKNDIGKSTILLQTSGELCKSNKKVLYVSAEESASQLKLRAQRLNIDSDNLFVYQLMH